MPKSERAKTLLRNMRLSTCDGITAVPVCYLVLQNNFIVAALLVSLFKMPPEVYGVICSMPFWGNFIQAFVMPFFNRRLLPKTVTMLTALVQAFSWVVMAVIIAYLPLDNPRVSSPWFIIIFAISSAATAMTTVGWISWVQEWVPRRIRGKYFGLRNRFSQISQVVFLLGVGQLLTFGGNSIRTFQILIGVSAALRVFSVYTQYRTKAGTGWARRQESKLPWRQQFSVIAATKPFLWFVAFGTVWGFSANFFGPFYPVFMIEQLNRSLSDVSFLIVLTSVGGAISYPAWGALNDRFGSKPVLLFAMISWQAQYAMWCFLTPSNAWLLYSMWAFSGIMNAGVTISLFNIQLKLIPPAAKTLAISFNLAVTALVTAIAPILGGWTLQMMLDSGMPALKVYHILFMVLPVTALLGCLLLWRVHEVNARPLSSVVGAMRNIRTVSAMLGLGFFMDHIFYKPTARKSPPPKP